jgi:hypothetical protein
MRSVWSFALLLLTGCSSTVPTIPLQVQPAEYEIYRAWMDHKTRSNPNHLPFSVRDLTADGSWYLTFEKRCLPKTMQHVFDSTLGQQLSLKEHAPTDWLSLTDGSVARLWSAYPVSNVPIPVESITFSRVAFNGPRSEAYMWVDDISCSQEHTVDCDGGEGALYHARKPTGRTWVFEKTECRNVIFD